MPVIRVARREVVVVMYDVEADSEEELLEKVESGEIDLGELEPVYMSDPLVDGDPFIP
jgi:hypothetical protein